MFSYNSGTGGAIVSKLSRYSSRAPQGGAKIVGGHGPGHWGAVAWRPLPTSVASAVSNWLIDLIRRGSVGVMDSNDTETGCEAPCFMHTG